MTAEMNRDDFLVTGDKLAVERVDFEDGKHCFVKEMSGGERGEWEESQMIFKKKDGRVVSMEQDPSGYRPKLLVRTICDEKGKLLFKVEEYKRLGNKISRERMSQIFEKAQELNGIKDDGDEGNSGAEDTGSSSSDSAES